MLKVVPKGLFSFIAKASAATMISWKVVLLTEQPLPQAGREVLMHWGDVFHIQLTVKPLHRLKTSKKKEKGKRERGASSKRKKQTQRNPAVRVPMSPSPPCRRYRKYMGDLTLKSHTLESAVNKDVFGGPRNS